MYLVEPIFHQFPWIFSAGTKALRDLDPGLLLLPGGRGRVGGDAEESTLKGDT